MDTAAEEAPSPAPLSQAEKEALYLAAAPFLKPAQLAQLHRLEELARDWNGRINLVSRKDVDNLAERHIAYSLAIARWHPFAAGTQAADLGSGGGFPGLPLAIAFPEVSFTLIDSTAKKMNAAREMAAALGLKNVEAVWQRVEEHKKQYDFVLGRAVTALPAFMNMARPLVHCRSRNPWPNGVLYLKGALEEDKAALKAGGASHPLSDLFPGSFYETKVLLYLPCCKKAAQAPPRS